MSDAVMVCPSCHAEIHLAVTAHEVRTPAPATVDAVWHSFCPDCKQLALARGRYRVGVQFHCRCGCAWIINGTSHPNL